MLKEWNIEVNLLLALVALGGMGGWALGHPGWGVALALAGWSLRMLWAARALLQWLRSDEQADVPESTGLWGAIFDNLYQKSRQQRQRLAHLHGIIDRIRQSTNAITDAVILTDSVGNLDWWNHAATRLLGLQTSTDRGQPITHLVRDPRFVRFYSQTRFDSMLEIPSARQSGQKLQFQITVFGEGDRLIVVRDTTRLHHLEQMRKDFVANVSHELRTPLTVIKGYLETFIEMLDSDNAPLKRGLGQMQQQTQRMEMLVNDLLLLSRLEAAGAPVVQKPVAVAALLRQVQNDALAINDQKRHQIVLETDDSLRLSGDENQLRSAFSNLVVNAVKYTPEQGRILIRWWADDSGAHLAVQDNGIGIEARHIPRLTERFYRADPSRHAKTGGTGLGLAIVKHVLLHHGGQLQIDSTPGKGSTFTCHFPATSIVRT